MAERGGIEQASEHGEAAHGYRKPDQPRAGHLHEREMYRGHADHFPRCGLHIDERTIQRRADLRVPLDQPRNPHIDRHGHRIAEVPRGP